MVAFLAYLIKKKKCVERLAAWNLSTHQYDEYIVGFELMDTSVKMTIDGEAVWFLLLSDVEADIQTYLENHYGIEIRFCSECGKPMQFGFMEDGGWWYACEDCFEVGMDRRFGKDKWRITSSEYPPYYEAEYDDGAVEGLDIYYTEFY